MTTSPSPPAPVSMATPSSTSSASLCSERWPNRLPVKASMASSLRRASEMRMSWSWLRMAAVSAVNSLSAVSSVLAL